MEYKATSEYYRVFDDAVIPALKRRQKRLREAARVYDQAVKDATEEYDRSLDAITNELPRWDGRGSYPDWLLIQLGRRLNVCIHRASRFDRSLKKEVFEIRRCFEDDVKSGQEHVRRATDIFTESLDCGYTIKKRIAGVMGQITSIHLDVELDETYERLVAFMPDNKYPLHEEE